MTAPTPTDSGGRYQYVIPPEIASVLESEGNSHEFESHGLQCVMYRNKDSKTWCGYVLLPEGHPLIGKEMNEVDFVVHGGVTFCGALSTYPERWAIGFDCHHAWDMAAYLDVLGPMFSGVYRNKAYVVSECESLAKQIANYVAPEPVPDTITLPASTHARLLAIEAAARTLVDGAAITERSDCSWCGQQPSAVTWESDFKRLKEAVEDDN